VCTVTIVPAAGGFRLSCNRDERRDRPRASPPEAHAMGRHVATFPTDPTGGGTWVGVNDAGLAAAVLNRTPSPPAPRRREGLRSRGLIIPALMDRTSLAEALEAAAALSPGAFDMFRLVLAQGDTAAVVTSDGAAFSIAISSLTQPIMLTSSSLGDAVVEEPRRLLFERLFACDAKRWLGAQRRFHRHQWHSRQHLSVRMERADARTVSRTDIDVRSRRIDLRYCPIEDGESAEAS
jgi:Transport and Golgi organisation 2